MVHYWNKIDYTLRIKLSISIYHPFLIHLEAYIPLFFRFSTLPIPIPFLDVSVFLSIPFGDQLKSFLESFSFRSKYRSCKMCISFCAVLLFIFNAINHGNAVHKIFGSKDFTKIGSFTMFTMLYFSCCLVEIEWVYGMNADS